MLSTRTLFVLGIALLLFSSNAYAFGAGNIASISRIEGRNWRHGDIEDLLKTVAFIKGHKWTSMMIKRVYFGNWLRDYSQAVDVGSLKGVPSETIRILVWILSFMSFGYATAEFEVTSERLGVYRPEEHIDNPKDYADNEDARQYDRRLRPPVMPEEIAIDPRTGMKNYIANDTGKWATSLGYVKYSFARSIHFGRLYTNGAAGTSGKEADLCEALRCLGQGLHCLEDFGAHTNYVELSLREMGFHNVFPHVGTATQIHLGGKTVFPLVTGTFGGVDFLHSVLGEATDHVTQSEVDEMNKALADASAQNTRSGGTPEAKVSGLTDLLSQIPGTSALCQEAVGLQRASDEQAAENARLANANPGYDAYDTYSGDRAAPSFAPPPTIDAQATIAKIYPILAFRDRVVRAISSVISVIPGLESIIEKIQEAVTLFIMSLLAPFIQPVIKAATQQLKVGSSTVIDASGRHQFEPWTDPHCTDPTHSLLSKDHFSNILNEPAGRVAGAILKYCAPRVLYAWENPSVPVDQVMNDISQVFHHPALRNHHSELQRNMFGTVEEWVQGLPKRGANLNDKLSSQSVKDGKNHIGGHGHGGHASHAASANSKIFGLGSHSKVSGSPFAFLGGGKREIDDFSELPGAQADQGNQIPQPPVDYTAYDPSTYSTAYSQGYVDRPEHYGQQQANYSDAYSYDYNAPSGSSWNAPPPQQPPYNFTQQGQGDYYANPPPPQQQQQYGWGGDSQYPPQQGYDYQNQQQY